MPYIHHPLIRAAALALLLHASIAVAQTVRPTDPVALGRYLVQTTGCNDCHTARYGELAGKVPEAEWLTGDALGFRGPWGTSYPTNLRLFAAGMTRAQWLQHARSMQPRPPMPWFNLRAMSDDDLGAIHAYLKAAGAAGQPAPAYVPPGQLPKPPFIQWPQ
ncbi:MAG TPA: c-type cytochrome [Rubrivivax sp.]